MVWVRFRQKQGYALCCGRCGRCMRRLPGQQTCAFRSRVRCAMRSRNISYCFYREHLSRDSGETRMRKKRLQRSSSGSMPCALLPSRLSGQASRRGPLRAALQPSLKRNRPDCCSASARNPRTSPRCHARRASPTHSRPWPDRRSTAPHRRRGGRRFRRARACRWRPRRP